MQSSINTLEKIFKSLRSYSRKDALYEFTQNSHGRRCTYQELADRSESLARGLLYKNILQGEQVGLMARPSIEAVIAALAIIRSGSVLLPIDPQLDTLSLIHIFNDASPRLLFVDSDTYNHLLQLSETKIPPLLLLENIDTHCKNTGILPQLSHEDPAILLYTSGTTGPPKGVPLSNKNISFELDAVAKSGLINCTDRLLLPLPLHHVYPLIIGLFVPLNLGLTVILPASITGARLLQAISEGDVSVIIGVPRLYYTLHKAIIQRLKSSGGLRGKVTEVLIWMLVLMRNHLGIRLGKLLLYPLHKRFGPHLRMLASGGAALSRDLFIGLEALGWQVATGYGLTETSPLLTLSGSGKSRPGSAGQILGGVELRVDTSAAPRGAAKDLGEIQARGPNVFHGYRNLKGATDDAFTSDGWFRTGDLGYVDKDSYIYLSDRISSVIVTENGENIQPDEVEAIYELHPSIKEIGVLQHEGKLSAVIVPQTKAIASEGFSVKDGIRIAIEEQHRQLPSYKRITGFVISFQEIPRTRLGKIKRHLLAQSFTHLTAELEKKSFGKPLSIDKMSGKDRELLLNPAARQAWEILSNRFKNSPLTLDSLPMVDLGIDSLAWFELTLEIRDCTGVEIDDRAIASIHTIRDLMIHLVDRSKDAAFLKADPFENPEKALEPYQSKWLAPLSSFHKLCRFGLYLINWVLNHTYFRLTVHGLENLQSAGQYIITPNHVSYVDTFVLAAAISYPHLCRTVWAAGVEVAFRNRLNRFVSRLGGAVPIEHGMGARSDILLIAAAIDRKKNIVWYPEGRRAPGKDFLPFRPGIGLLLQRRPISVIPVIIQGTDRAMPIGSKFPHPYHVSVTFGKSQTVSELMGTAGKDGVINSQSIVIGLRTTMEKLRNQVVSRSV